jgi:hypothetical protein
MRAILTLLLVGFLAVSIQAVAQEAEPGAPEIQSEPQAAPFPEEAPAPAEEAPASLEQTAEGELARLDAENKLLWIKTADGMEKQFSYTDETIVMGEADSVEGLSPASGHQLKVHFESEGGLDTAVKIEVMPSQA